MRKQQSQSSQEIPVSLTANSAEAINDKTCINNIYSASDENKDYFIEQNGVKFSGRHLIIDLWGAKHIDNILIVENALRDAVDACGATLLHIHLHHFTPNGGISGVAVLAESHISIHTWPERKYAALDVFMCGNCLPVNSLSVLKDAFKPERINVNEQMRGAIYE